MSDHEGRTPHPCIGHRCGHATESHLRTPELESYGETVLWCTDCRRHEVRQATRGWWSRRTKVELGAMTPFRAS